jgi:tetratricopeptide (TPR) repeat protein
MFLLARECGNEVYQGMALRFLGVAAQLTGNMEKAEKILKESVALFEKIGGRGRNYTLSLLAAWSYIGEIRHWMGGLDQALKIFEYCIENCHKANLSWGLSLFYSKAGNVAFDMGLEEEAQRHISQSINLFEQGQGGRSGSIAYSLRAVFDARTGRYTQALQAMQRAENLCMPINKRSWIAVHYTAAYKIKKLLEKSPSVKIEAAPLNDFLSESSFAYAEKAICLCEDLRILPKLKMLKQLY